VQLCHDVSPSPTPHAPCTLWSGTRTHVRDATLSPIVTHHRSLCHTEGECLCPLKLPTDAAQFLSDMLNHSTDGIVLIMSVEASRWLIRASDQRQNFALQCLSNLVDCRDVSQQTLLVSRIQAFTRRSELFDTSKFGPSSKRTTECHPSLVTRTTTPNLSRNVTAWPSYVACTSRHRISPHRCYLRALARYTSTSASECRTGDCRCCPSFTGAGNRGSVSIKFLRACRLIFKNDAS